MEPGWDNRPRSPGEPGVEAYGPLYGKRHFPEYKSQVLE